MALNNYSSLVTALGDWLNRADLTSQIPDFILLAEGTLNKVVRSTRMVTTASVAYVATGTAACPTDMLEPIYMELTSTPTETLERVTPEQLAMLRRARTRTSGTPRYFCVVGRNILITPTPSGSNSYTLHYYQAIPALVTATTNWLLTYHPELYLYASLLHAAPFLHDEARTTLMDNITTKQIMAAVQMQGMAMPNSKVAGFSLDSPSDMGARMLQLPSG